MANLGKKYHISFLTNIIRMQKAIHLQTQFTMISLKSLRNTSKKAQIKI